MTEAIPPPIRIAVAAKAAWAWADLNHTRLCGCSSWPTACVSGLTELSFETEATDVATSVAWLAGVEHERARERGDI